MPPLNLLVGIRGPGGAKRASACTASVVRSQSYHGHVRDRGDGHLPDTFEALVVTREEESDSGPLPWSLCVHTDAAMHDELRRYYPWAILRETNTVELKPHTNHRIGPDEAPRCMEWHIRTPSLCFFLWFGADSWTGLWVPWRTTDPPSRPHPRLHTPLYGDTVYQPFPTVRPWCLLHRRRSGDSVRLITWLPEGASGVRAIGRTQFDAAVHHLRSKQGCHVQVVRTPARNQPRTFLHVVLCTTNDDDGQLTLRPVPRPAWAYGFVSDQHSTVRTFWYSICAVADHFTPLGSSLPAFERVVRPRLLSLCPRHPRRPPPSEARPKAAYDGMAAADAREASIDAQNHSLYGDTVAARVALQGALQSVEALSGRLRASEVQHTTVRQRLHTVEATVVDLQRQLDEGRVCAETLKGLETRLHACREQLANPSPELQRVLADALGEVRELRRRQQVTTEAVRAAKAVQAGDSAMQDILGQALLQIRQLRSDRQRALEALQQARSQSQSCSPELQALLEAAMTQLRECKASLAETN